MSWNTMMRATPMGKQRPPHPIFLTGSVTLHYMLKCSVLHQTYVRAFAFVFIMLNSVRVCKNAEILSSLTKFNEP